MPARILVIDDEPNIQAAVCPLLASSGYEVVTAITGRGALEAVGRHRPDIVVLDLGLPDIDGVEVCRLIREEHQMPIIVLSARAGEKDKIRALDAGADDYVTKPFGSGELLARIRVALRRAGAEVSPGGLIAIGDLAIDRERRRVMRAGEDIRLTPKEFDLLVFFAQRPGRVLTHKAILRAIWGPHAVDQPEHLRVLVAALRKKIERDPTRPVYITTEPWIGYRIAEAQ